jgi:hypothetical protein
MRLFRRAIFCVPLVLLALWLARSFSLEQDRVTAGVAGASGSRVVAWLGAFVAVLVVLGVAVAFQLSRFFGDRAGKFFLFGGPEVKAVPEMDRAERLRKREPLEAVRILRDYLRRNPGETPAMARIAEIYEQDLRNNLAAALEYEELLKQHLPPENWGWSAVHLANLYLGLGKSREAAALLERIVREHGRTSAAAKARKRLLELSPLDAPPTNLRSPSRAAPRRSSE